MKPLYWIGSSKRDLQALPEQVVDVFGYALHLAQIGGKHSQAKPLHGFGSAGILEIVEDHDGNTYRAIYTVQIARRIFVLHVFQNKSKRGIATPKSRHAIDREADANSRADSQGDRAMKKNRISDNAVEKSSGNVYSDLGYHDSGAMLIKAQLVAKISEIIRTRNLTQSEAASKLGLTQPKISALLKGNFRGISERRLLDCLTRLGRDVQIVIRPIPKNRRNGQLSVLFT